MVTVDTYWAKIFVGFKKDAEFTYCLDAARNICSEYVNNVGLCVTLTPTEYIYSQNESHGYFAGEPGAIIGLINYPKSPCDSKEIREKALELARILKAALEQHRVTVMFPDETIMLGEIE